MSVDASAYESRRLENIRRNQALLNELGIEKRNLAIKQEASRRPAAQKRKLSPSIAKPARASARIASSVTRPNYNEDVSLRATQVSSSRNQRTRTANNKVKREPVTAAPVVDTSSPPPDLQDIRAGWTSWDSVAPPPTRDEDGTFHFDSHPTFLPNKSPAEMLAEGAFGGSYYRPLYSKSLRTTIEDDWKELPEAWLTNLNVDTHLTSTTYDPEVNKFRVKCGQSIEEWEAAGWIAHAYDVRGWFQWYTRFWMGRRCDDDDRQVGRWDRCAGRSGRWRRMLLKKYLQAGVRTVADEGMDDGEEVSPVMHQTCHQWAFEVRQQDLDDAWAGKT
ncbi:hypothetical protein AAFC00_000457 [Neodothiora populina]|uniref:Vegetatible incompatibility protein HET-E-1 n=1 Tax=Neodothiora populina TaxID=2781224 RepID=A0ABR3PCY2_9PEZI